MCNFKYYSSRDLFKNIIFLQDKGGHGSPQIPVLYNQHTSRTFWEKNNGDPVAIIF